MNQQASKQLTLFPMPPKKSSKPKKTKRKLPGHYCRACGRRRANEKFSGKGHATHICKDCAQERRAEARKKRSDTATLQATKNLTDGVTNVPPNKANKTVLVLFEVTIKEEGMNQYFALAEALKESLTNAEGFIRAERFSSVTSERKFLSLSVWKSGKAVQKWRNRVQHRMSQQQGRDSLFESYVITVATPIRTYTNVDRTEAPEDSNRIFENKVL